MMIKRADCNHERVVFGSGDYYVFCCNCDARWGALNSWGIPEYEFGPDGKIRVGCDSSVCTNTQDYSGERKKC